MNVLAVYVGRMSSSRLPGKVLAPILGRSMMDMQIERIRRAACFDHLIVATSDDASDDPIEAEATRLGLACHRGSMTDIADRLYKAAQPYQPTHILRIGGDCPLIDPQLLRDLVALHLQGNDWTNTYYVASWPDGLDSEMYTFACLERVYKEAVLPSEREHVAPFMENRADQFRIGVLQAERDYTHLRLTVDHPEDLELVRTIYAALYPVKPAFTFADVLAFLAERPELAASNRHYVRNAGRLKSLEADQAFLSEKA